MRFQGLTPQRLKFPQRLRFPRLGPPKVEVSKFEVPRLGPQRLRFPGSKIGPTKVVVSKVEIPKVGPPKGNPNVETQSLQHKRSSFKVWKP